MNNEGLIFNAILNIAQQEMLAKQIDRSAAIELAEKAVDSMLEKARTLAQKYDSFQSQ